MDKEKVMNLIGKAHTQLNQVEVKGIQAAEGLLITAKLLEAAADELNKAEAINKEENEVDATLEAAFDEKVGGTE